MGSNGDVCALKKAGEQPAIPLPLASEHEDSPKASEVGGGLTATDIENQHGRPACGSHVLGANGRRAGGPIIKAKRVYWP
jgi:hypothetical protein